jgi:hypothetical protein
MCRAGFASPSEIARPKTANTSAQTHAERYRMSNFKEVAAPIASVCEQGQAPADFAGL